MYHKGRRPAISFTGTAWQSGDEGRPKGSSEKYLEKRGTIVYLKKIRPRFSVMRFYEGQVLIHK
jgi:hypothetical protein